MSYHYRITKYNPQNRDDQGRYLIDEWISYGDIGDYADLMTFDKYFAVETKYVDAIMQFMKCNKIDSLEVVYLEKRGKLEKDINNSKAMKEVYKGIKTGDVFDKVRLDALFRLILRNHLWCKLKNGKKMEVHFGYDYYMYIVSKVTCLDTVRRIETNGLFVEKFKSPYFTNDDFVNNLNILDGHIICKEFNIDEGLSFEDQQDYFHQELLQIEFNNKLLIDVGWYPETDPDGEFIVRAVRDANYQKPLMIVRCRTHKALKEAIEQVALAITTQH